MQPRRAYVETDAAHPLRRETFDSPKETGHDATRVNGAARGMRIRRPVIRCAAGLGTRAEALAHRWRDKQLQYTWLRSLQARYVDFEQVTADALDYALDSLAIANPDLRDELLELYSSLPPFADARPTLEELHTMGVRSMILSNGTAAMLDRTVRAAKLEHLVSGVLSVDRIGIYKPDSRVYQMAVDALGVSPDRIVFVSANGWDAYAGAAFGFRGVWCNRAGAPIERLPGVPDRQILSLHELAPLLCAGMPRAPGR
jgi:2-haloacid dehalogenase